jgi:HSP20 family molecular chaperone IbpA
MNGRKPNDDRSLFPASSNTVPVCKQRVADTDRFPARDVSDTGGEYLVEFDLPGLTQEEIHFSQRGDALYVTGVRTTPNHGESSLRTGHPNGAFVRRLVLPSDSCRNEIQATFQDGVLRLRIPRETPQNKDATSRTVRSEDTESHHTPC